MADEYTVDVFNAREDAELGFNRQLIYSDRSAIREWTPSSFEEPEADLGETQTSFEVKVIEEVRNYECLWKTTARSFKETPKKAEAWRRISLKLHVEEKIITATWNKLRENFRKCLNRRKKASKSGASGKQLSTCQYFKELSFLTDVIGVRVTESNITSDIFGSATSENFPTPLMPVENSQIATTSNSTQVCTTMVQSAETVTTPINNVRSTTCRKTQQHPPLEHIAQATPRNNSRKRKPVDPIQAALEKALLVDIDQNKAAQKENDNPDELFCRSLVSSFKTLSKKKNKLAKIKILQVFIDLDSDSSDNDNS